MKGERTARYIIVIDGNKDIFLRRLVDEAGTLLALATEPSYPSDAPEWIKKIYQAAISEF